MALGRVVMIATNQMMAMTASAWDRRSFGRSGYSMALYRSTARATREYAETKTVVAFAGLTMEHRKPPMGQYWPSTGMYENGA
jgi:hypothetical protein